MGRADLADERMVVELARRLAREKIALQAAQLEETEGYPDEPMRLLARQGLGIWVPEAYGGGMGGLGSVARELLGRP